MIRWSSTGLLQYTDWSIGIILCADIYIHFRDCFLSSLIQLLLCTICLACEKFWVIEFIGNSSNSAFPLYSSRRRLGFLIHSSSQRLHFLATFPIPANHVVGLGKFRFLRSSVFTMMHMFKAIILEYSWGILHSIWRLLIFVHIGAPIITLSALFCATSRLWICIYARLVSLGLLYSIMGLVACKCS